jgi:hypothetical protein
VWIKSNLNKLEEAMNEEISRKLKEKQLSERLHNSSMREQSANESVARKQNQWVKVERVESKPKL